MLEVNYRDQISALLKRLECNVVLPFDWEEYTSRDSVVPPVLDDRRRFVRYNVSSKAVLEIDTTIPGIPRDHQFHCVYLKNLSRNGIGFFHSSQIYPGEAVVIWHQARKVAVTVVRCIRHNSHCFEIGADFTNRSGASCLNSPRDVES